jgi:hypothetical protein
MNAEEEARAVDQVVDRLAARFPDVSRDHVAAIVGEEHLELEGNPIRDFVPVLVEHEARERLRGEGATPTRIAEAADVSSLPPGPGPSPTPSAGEVPIETTFNARLGLLNGGLGGGTS